MNKALDVTLSIALLGVIVFFFGLMIISNIITTVGAALFVGGIIVWFIIALSRTAGE